MKHLMMKRIDLDEAKGNEDLHLCSISYDPKKFKNADNNFKSILDVFYNKKAA